MTSWATVPPFWKKKKLPCFVSQWIFMPCCQHNWQSNLCHGAYYWSTVNFCFQILIFRNYNHPIAFTSWLQFLCIPERFDQTFLHFLCSLHRTEIKLIKTFPFFVKKGFLRNFSTVKERAPCIQGFVLNSYWIIHMNSPRVIQKKERRNANLFLPDDGLFPQSWHTEISILDSVVCSCLIHNRKKRFQQTGMCFN